MRVSVISPQRRVLSPLDATGVKSLSEMPRWQASSTIRFGVAQPARPTFSWPTPVKKAFQQVLADVPLRLAEPETLEQTVLRPLNVALAMAMQAHPSFPEFRDPQPIAEVFLPAVKGVLALPEEARLELMTLMMVRDPSDHEAPHNYLQDLVAYTLEYQNGAAQAAPVLSVMFRELTEKNHPMMTTLGQMQQWFIKIRYTDPNVSEPADAFLTRFKERHQVDDLADHIACLWEHSRTSNTAAIKKALNALEPNLHSPPQSIPAVETKPRLVSWMMAPFRWLERWRGGGRPPQT